MLENISKAVHAVAVAAGVIASSMLLAGYSYYLGYIHAFGLDASLIGRGFGEVVAESWLMGLQLLVFILSKLISAIGVAVVLVVLMFASLFALASIQRKRPAIFSNQLNKQNQGRSVLGLSLWQWWVGIEGASQLFGWILAFFLPVAVVAAALVWPYQQGQNHGATTMSSYLEQGCGYLSLEAPAFGRCVSLANAAGSGQPALAEGMLVTATKDRLAIFNEAGVEIWSLSGDYKLHRPYSRAGSRNDAAEGAPDDHAEIKVIASDEPIIR